MDPVEAAHAHFWSVAEPFLARDAVTKGTMMGFPCLRHDGAFFASIEHKGTRMVVKLPRERVAEAVVTGEGESFAPAGRVFKEWLAVPHDRADRWTGLLHEAFAFVRGD